MTYGELRTSARFHERLCAILDSRCFQLALWNSEEPIGPLLLSALHEKDGDSAEGLVSHTLKVTAGAARTMIC